MFKEKLGIEVSHGRSDPWEIKQREQDWDIYTDISVCRYIFRDIIEKLMFPDNEVLWTSDEFPSDPNKSPGNVDYYKMEGLRRRISCSVTGVGDIDFIFMEEVPYHYERAPAFIRELLKKQASTTTEAVIRYDNFNPSKYWGYCTNEFLSIKEDRVAKVTTDPGRCTEQHYHKLEKFCTNNGIKLQKV